MNIVNHKNGKITKDGDFFYLEKKYKDLSQLLKDEELLIEKIEDNNFIYLDNDVSFCENPYYKLDKLYGKKTKKTFYKNIFKLYHAQF